MSYTFIESVRQEVPPYPTGNARRTIKHPHAPPPFDILMVEPMSASYNHIENDHGRHDVYDLSHITPENFHESFHVFNFSGFAQDEKVAMIYQFHGDTTEPQFVNEALRKLSVSHSRENPFPGEIVRHPGVNDKLCGALSSAVERPDWPHNDKTVCLADFENQVIFMPFRILNCKELTSFPGLFENPGEAYKKIGKEWYTTNWGLYKAVVECSAMDLRGYDWDNILLGSLARRIGLVYEELTCKVVYVEDIVPKLAVTDKLYDHEYWNDLRAEGETWRNKTDVDACLKITRQ